MIDPQVALPAVVVLAAVTAGCSGSATRTTVEDAEWCESGILQRSESCTVSEPAPELPTDDTRPEIPGPEQLGLDYDLLEEKATGRK